MTVLDHQAKEMGAVLEADPAIDQPNPLPPRTSKPSLLRRLIRGKEEDPRWVRPALLVLLSATAALYLWGLGASGWSNSFYSAAVEAGTKSWKAFFFGSFDSSNFITVDKPPASLWVMELSARTFGLSSWSILVPQALEGVATVGILYATVRRVSSAGAGLLAGAVMALTPVAVLMFRFNNPDALLVLLLTVAAYCTVRALQKGSVRWLALAGFLVGTGFITKMMQAFLVLPAIGVVYFLAAPNGWWRRIRQLVVTAAVTVASALWWPVMVMSIPSADRPYIGGSQDNSIWNLIFGYNGFGRLSGNESGSVGGFRGGGGGSPWGPTGWTRLFQPDMGGQVSWLIPAALILGAAALCYLRKRPRTDRTRASLLLWMIWLLLTAAVFSFAQGIIHPYYTVALAPAIAALVGIGGWVLWKRHDLVARIVLAVAVAGTAIWAAVLLGRSPDWLPWLGPLVLVTGLVVAIFLVASHWLGRRVMAGLAVVATALCLAGPTAYALDSAATPQGGAIPSAGPTVAGTQGGPGGFGGLRNRGGFAPPGAQPGQGSPGPGFPGGQGGFAPPGVQGGGNQSRGTFPRGLPGGGRFGGRGFAGGPGGGGPGGLLNATTPNSAVVRALHHNAGHYRWVLATVGANQAAGYQLASGEPTMAIGGFNGTDPSPSLAQFKSYVAKGQIHYFVGGSRGPAARGPGGGSGSSSAITSWVESHFPTTNIGGTTFYVLSQAG